MTTEEFIEKYRTEDARKLALQGARYPDVDMPYALDQIAGWQMARTKLPAWADTKGIIYPPHLSMEQCSSEQTAIYKRSILQQYLGENSGRLLDLTGGFGVDFSYLAQGFTSATYIERLPHLCEIAKKNFLTLSLTQAQVICADSTEYLQETESVDFIYLDPARRNENGGRTYAIEDCTPNVIEINDLLLKKAAHVMIKLSPMLDWHKTLDLLHGVSEVHIVSVKNECKELLLLLSRDAEETKVVCENDGQTLEFIHEQHFDEAYADRIVSGSYVYEPNASVMKAGCFGLLCNQHNVKKIAPHSNLFISDETVDFPGRAFHIMSATSMNKKELKHALSGIGKANIAVRNFPLTAEELRKRLKLKDGGDIYIFGTTDCQGNHLLLICRKIFTM